MNIKTFKGNFFEIGQQQGKIYKENGMSFDNIKIDPLLFKKQLQIYETHYPELLNEFKGMANGGNFNEDKLIYKFITGEIFYYLNKLRIDKACTIFGYKIKDNLYVGRNYDWLKETEKIFRVYKFINPERNSFIAISDMGISNPAGAKLKYLFYNADDAINDKGLFIGLTFAYTDKWSYGLGCIHLIKLITETCETVNDALKVFEKVPLSDPKNFFIADKNGDMAIVEHTSKKFKVLYPKDNVLIQTNHFIDSELAKEDLVLKQKPTHNTYLRFDETLKNINIEKNNFNHDSIIKILGKKGSYTCQNSPDLKTIWTLALDMNSKKYRIYWDIFGKRKTEELEI